MQRDLARAAGGWAATMGLAIATAAPAAALAGEPFERLGRLADTDGTVWVYDDDDQRWRPAERDQPLGEGDRIATHSGDRAVLQIGSAVLRLGEHSELVLTRLDDEAVRLTLAEGRMAIRLLNTGRAGQYSVQGAGWRLEPQRAGHYRADRSGPRIAFTVWDGRARLQPTGDRRGPLALLNDGDRLEVGEPLAGWREDSRLPALQHAVPDDFSRWARAAADDTWTAGDDAGLSMELTGWQDLHRHGRWTVHVHLGRVWIPHQVPVGWAPYRRGRWAWVRPGGWVWVEPVPWGFVTFRAGRWAAYDGRWCWVPGPLVRGVYPGHPPVRWQPPPRPPVPELRTERIHMPALADGDMARIGGGRPDAPRAMHRVAETAYEPRRDASRDATRRAERDAVREPTGVVRIRPRDDARNDARNDDRNDDRQGRPLRSAAR